MAAQKEKSLLVGDDAVVLPLSEATAASEVLYALEYGDLTLWNNSDEGGWLKQWALDALKRSLNEAKTGLRRLHDDD